LALRETFCPPVLPVSPWQLSRTEQKTPVAMAAACRLSHEAFNPLPRHDPINLSLPNV
jgi:hypothetical protein